LRLRRLKVRLVFGEKGKGVYFKRVRLRWGEVNRSGGVGIDGTTSERFRRGETGHFRAGRAILKKKRMRERKSIERRPALTRALLTRGTTKEHFY